jgi:hypothetical protein
MQLLHEHGPVGHTLPIDEGEHGGRVLLRCEGRLRIARPTRRTRAPHDRTNPRTLAGTMRWLIRTAVGPPVARVSGAMEAAVEACWQGQRRPQLAPPA